QHLAERGLPAGKVLHARGDALQEGHGGVRVVDALATDCVSGVNVPVRADGNQRDLDPIQVIHQPVASRVHGDVADGETRHEHRGRGIDFVEVRIEDVFAEDGDIPYVSLFPFKELLERDLNELVADIGGAAFG